MTIPRHDIKDLAGNARQKALDAYEEARDNLGQAAGKAKDSLSDNPLIALAGGIAAGAILAAVLPKTEKERELVGPTARRVRDSAKAAKDAAATTGTERLKALGVTREKGEQTVKGLIDNITDAVKASLNAASEAARKG